jgi:DNA-binding PadR family transcriptional regulator
MELSATAKVILGMLAMGPHSGYEIKSFSDDSTRFFWAASYGQIYPELRRLADAGLIEGTNSPTGGRQRTVFELTRAGRHALEEWHDLPAEVHEVRDEGLLQLFLADAVAPDRKAEICRRRAEQALETADQLREVQTRKTGDADSSAMAVLGFGVAYHDFIAEWFERQALAFEEGLPLEQIKPTPNAPHKETS